MAVSSITLHEPNIYRYLNMTNCSYRNGTLLNHPTELVSAKGEALRVSNLYDTIININVIEHVQDALLYLSNIYEALKPGGLLIFHERWHNNPDYAKCKPNGDFYLHPIRIKDTVIQYFTSLFSKAMYQSTAPTPDMVHRVRDLCPGDTIETAIYTALIK